MSEPAPGSLGRGGRARSHPAKPAGRRLSQAGVGRRGEDQDRQVLDHIVEAVILAGRGTGPPPSAEDQRSGERGELARFQSQRLPGLDLGARRQME